MCLAVPVSAQQAAPPADLPPPQRQPGPSHYGPDELVGAGHKFFGNVSRGLASVIERAVSQWGLPNGYILGEEGSGAFVAGLRYGEGTLYTKNAGDLRVFWQGPSVGFDWGGDGARTMTLVYNLPATAAIYQRFAGIDGSAYIIGGFGMTALTANNIVLVPIRSGLGLRLGANIGYLKYHAARDLESVLTLPGSRRIFERERFVRQRRRPPIHVNGAWDWPSPRTSWHCREQWVECGRLHRWSSRSCIWRSVFWSRCCLV